MYPPDMESFVKNLPGEFESLVSMGNVLMDQQRYALAMECYSRALAQRPDDADIQVDMGTCQHALGQNEAAIASFTKALENKPDHKIAKFNLGIVNYSLGDTAQAAQWWNRLLAENPPADLKARTEAMLAKLRGK
jgi:tetratricopeptide (TPR) repeat protein